MAFTVMSQSVTNLMVEEYGLNSTGPFMDRCGTKKSMPLLVEYASLTQTLKPLFCRYVLNHFSATSLIPNFLSRTFKST